MLANHVHPFLLAVIPDVTDIFPQDNLLYFMAMTGLRNMTKSLRCRLSLRSKNHTLQLKGSTANAVVSVTTRQFQRSLLISPWVRVV